MLLLIKLFFMGALLTGGLKTYADTPLLNENPLLSGIGGIFCIIILLYVFPKLISFIFKFAFFTFVILCICHLCGWDFDAIVQKLAKVDVSPVLEKIPENGASGKSVTGRVSKVLNGRAFVFEGQNVQLYGIDTPDLDQHCTSSNGMSYACGEQSFVELNALLAQKNVTCTLSFIKQEGRQLATCYVDDMDVAALMVRDGWAIADKGQSDKYVEEEKSAYLRHMGMWNGRFQEPQKWRQTREAQNKEKATPSPTQPESNKSSLSPVRGIKKLFGITQ